MGPAGGWRGRRRSGSHGRRLSLAVRVIGTLLVDGPSGQVVHRERFRTLYPRNPPITQAQIYARRSMDEILMLDVTAAEPDYELIADVVGNSFLPVAYGGGITSVEQARRIVSECGADKLVLCSRADLIGAIAQVLGAQAVMVSVNALGRMAVSAARTAARLGAGEILLQSVDRDGMLSGYDLELIRSVSGSVSIPVIASSGCRGPADMVEAMRAGADAVAAGWLWDATDKTPLECKRALREAGYVVRIPEEAAI